MKEKLESNKKETNKKSVNNRWTWHHFIMRLCKGLNRDLDKVYEMSFVGSLNWLMYLDHIDELNRPDGVYH